MSKDEFYRRFTHKYSTLEKRRELYGKMAAIQPSSGGDAVENASAQKIALLMLQYDEKSETEQVVAIHNEIKYRWWSTVPPSFLKKVVFFLLTTLDGALFGLFSSHLIRKVAPINLPKDLSIWAGLLGTGAGATLGMYGGDILRVPGGDQIRSTFMKKTGLDKL